MERETGESALPPPRENFIIAGKPLNIRRLLDKPREDFWSSMRDYPSKEWGPGDGEALTLIQTLRGWDVTSKEYFTVMPRLLEYAAKPEGGFDADFINITHYLMKKVLSRRGGLIKVFHSPGSEVNRTAYLADVYGQAQAVRDFILRDPAMEGKKKQALEMAEKYKQRDWPI